MTAADWIAVVVGTPAVGSSVAITVSKLTRIAVAAENLAEKIDKLTDAQSKTDGQVQDHEVRLAKGGL